MAPRITSPPEVAAETLQWSGADGEQLTVVVKATFSLPTLGLAQMIGPVPLDERDRVPVKAGADVLVHGSVRPAKTRRLVGAALARGTEIIWSRRLVHSFVDGEQEWTALDGSPAPTGLEARSSTPGEGALIDDETDLSRFNAAPSDQRLEMLRGGEHILLVGYGAADVMCRLPAARAHATVSPSGRAIPLLGDTLWLDADRQLVSVTWRGHATTSECEGGLEIAILPLVAVEEIVGAPPSWLRSPRRPPPDRPPIVGDCPMPAATMPRLAAELPIVVRGTFELVDDSPSRLRDDQPPLDGDIFFDDAPGTSLQRPSDWSPVKDEVDVVATGFVYSRDGATVATTRLQLGTIDKRVVAIGPRHWDRGVLTAPLPFERVAMRYEHAFGSPDVDRNPLGTGAGGTAPPQLEHPEQLMHSATDRPPPACLAPLPPSWPCRQGGGTFDDAWVARQWPALPTDFDRRAHQVAPTDQRCASLRGDEAFVLSSMRPGGGDHRGALPGVRPWCFAWRAGECVVAPLKLDTVTFDAEQAEVGLVWRGEIQAVGVERLWLTAGSIDEGPPLPRAWGALASARDERFAAPDQAVGSSMAALAARLAEVARQSEDMLRGGLAPRAAPEPAARDQILAWLADDDLADRDLSGADLRDVDLSGKTLLGCTLAGALLDGACLDGVDLGGAVLSRIRAVDSSWRGARLDGVDLCAADLSGADLSEASLEHANLEDARLDGATFRGAKMRGADMTRASLRGGCLDEAALERAALSRATFDRATFRRADLTDAKLYDAEGDEVIVDDATLNGARFEGARLPRMSACEVRATSTMWEGAVLTRTKWLVAVLVDASFNGACLDGALLNQADLTRARLRGATLTDAKLLRANLMHADLASADLTRADLRGANLFGAELRDANWAGAKTELALVAGTRLDLGQ
jgi:uncharacterized protein YjbI with pentapeptide repeats